MIGSLRNLRRWFPLGRLLALASLALVLALLAAKVFGGKSVAEEIDVTAAILAGLAILLAFVCAAPGEAKEFFDRLTNLKFGSVEIGLQAAVRVERVELRVASFDDNVKALTPRARGGSAAEEFEAVGDKLRERLDFVRDVIFELDSPAGTLQIVDAIRKRRLLEPDEEQVVSDLLGDAKGDMVRLDPGVRKRYLDSAWRFASRFATLILERQVRKEMVAKKWLLLDFDQARSHRPDFLAYRDSVWLLVATRVEPGQAEKTRRRLSDQTVPHDAHKVIVYPTRRAGAAMTVGDKYPDVNLVPAGRIANYRGPCEDGST
jgi:hypothetical protein